MHKRNLYPVALWIAALICLCTGFSLSTEIPTANAASSFTAHLPLVISNEPVDPDLIYADDFDVQTDDWPVFDDAYGSMTYVEGWYQMLIRDAQGGLWAFPPWIWTGDYLVTVDTRIAQLDRGMSYGIVFDYEDDDNFATFTMSSYGDFGLFRLFNGQWQVLTDWQLSNAILPGDAINTLAIEVVGTSYVAFINGVEVAAGGGLTGAEWVSAALEAWPGEEAVPAAVRFDNLDIRWVPLAHQAVQSNAVPQRLSSAVPVPNAGLRPLGIEKVTP